MTRKHPALRAIPSLALGAAYLALAAASASAGNEDDFFVGDTAAMTGGAVTATVDDGSAGFYNHAGLAAVERDRIDVSGSAYALRLYTATNFLRIADGPARDTSVHEFVAIPTQIAYVRKLGPDTALGLGYFVPRAENALLSDRLSGGDADDGSSWSLDVRSSSASYWLTAALGLRLSERVRFGFGLFGIYEDRVESTALQGSTREGGLVVQGISQSTLGTSTKIGAAPGAGLQLDLTRALTLGLWARGPRVQISSGERTHLNFFGAAPDGLGGTLLISESETIEDSGEQLGFVDLGRYYLGAAHRFGDTTLSVGGDLQPGLRSARTAVDRRLAVNARLGVLHALSEDLVVGAGLFSDRTTEGASDTASEVSFYGGTLGVRMRDLLGLARSERAGSLGLTSVFAVRYAYGSGTIATLVARPDGALVDAFTLGQGAMRVHEFGLHIGSGLEL